MNITEFFEPNLVKKYDSNGPRYTSYPTALSFHDSFVNDDVIKALKTTPNNKASLYFHIPFCHSLCYYCACNKIVTRHSEKADEYLQFLFEEMSNRQSLLSRHKVQQVHLGGGTPSFLTIQQLTNFIAHLHRTFSIEQDAEISIEIDPRNLPLDYINHLSNIGFNRISIGVQDIDPKVQKAINRVQSTDFIHALVDRVKEIGMGSVNLDLIYGLPHQSLTAFAQTLDRVIEMDADRISLFNYAHMPDRFAAQRKIRDHWLPSTEQKLELMQMAIERLLLAGYVMIGMDHFAKPSDELAVAQAQGKLHRNFQGYTTHSHCDLVGFGVSSISHIGDIFSQNRKDLQGYYANIREAGNAVCRGVKLTVDDQIRGYVIGQLMCNLSVNKTRVNQLFDIEFDHYFEQSLNALQPFITDGLIENGKQQIHVSARARFLIRSICMSFDAHINLQNTQRYSRVM
ncbi:oxygen-independent coproporphyrinogen III oxidase [Aliiglaciecola sp. LCG003]|uniref:oxygen-independent coproporphyrinogen III oxidase n=1 Tax=Aliiglaciecola sp. LCG003 TaxID=3053655 RepID=UPI002572FB9C|nr:oxygen-independent coproporphyrinogen III oxidase [Aliiglaciecola sp. LCG003]WJG10339.1 oxygen-independent coproporphyrinogen III oxidase [Aliiglaciecola sp. LCG003]